MRILKPLPGTLPMPGHILTDAGGLWPMNSLGDQVYDLSGNGEIGTFNALTKWSLGKFGYCVEFHAAGAGSDKITMVSEIVGAGDATLYAWIYVKAWSFRGTIFWNGRAWLRINSATHVLEFASNSVTFASSAALPALNTWYFVAVTRDNTGAKTNLYVDGLLSGTANQNSGTPAAGVNSFVIGNDTSNARDFYGKIDVPAIYHRILPVSQIALIHKNSFCMFPESRVFAA